MKGKFRIAMWNAPDIYIDPQESQPEIVELSQIVRQCREVLAVSFISDEHKKTVVGHIEQAKRLADRYYEKKKEDRVNELLNEEVVREIMKYEKLVREKQVSVAALRAQIEDKKHKTAMAQARVNFNKSELRNLREKRSALAFERDRLASRAAEDEKFWQNATLRANEQSLRMDEFLHNSPYIAKQETDKARIESLTEQLANLKVQKDSLMAETAENERELAEQTKLPRNIWITKFVENLIKYGDIRDKAMEAVNVLAKRRAEEIQRKKSSSQGMDFDMTLNMSQLPESGCGSQVINSQQLLDHNQSTAVDGSQLASPDTTANKSASSPPTSSDEELRRNRASDITNYVAQQAALSHHEAVPVSNVMASQDGGSNASQQDSELAENDIEVDSSAGDVDSDIRVNQDEEMDETVDENEHTTRKGVAPIIGSQEYAEENEDADLSMQQGVAPFIGSQEYAEENEDADLSMQQPDLGEENNSLDESELVENDENVTSSQPQEEHESGDENSSGDLPAERNDDRGEIEIREQLTQVRRTQQQTLASPQVMIDASSASRDTFAHTTSTLSRSPRTPSKKPSDPVRQSPAKPREPQRPTSSVSVNPTPAPSKQKTTDSMATLNNASVENSFLRNFMGAAGPDAVNSEPTAAFSFGFGDANGASPTEAMNISVNSNDPGGDFLAMMQRNTGTEGEPDAAGGDVFNFSSMFGGSAGGGASDAAAGGGGNFNFFDNLAGSAEAGSADAGGGGFDFANFNFGGGGDASASAGQGDEPFNFNFGF